MFKKQGFMFADEIWAMITEHPRQLSVQELIDQASNQYINALQLSKQIVENRMTKLASLCPLFDLIIRDVYGMGKVSAAYILAHLPPHWPEKPSKLIAYWLGYKDGKPARKRKGEKMKGIARMRSQLLGVAWRNLVIHNPNYNKIYQERKKKAKLKHPEWAILTRKGKVIREDYKEHYHRDAVRVMTQEVIRDVYHVINNYLEWRKNENN